MKVPEDYEGPALEIYVRTSKPVDNTQEVIQKVLSNIKGGSKVAIYQKDALDGDVTEQTLKALSREGINQVEMKDFMEKVHMTKIEPELENLDIGGRFVKWTFDNIIKEVEDIIDAEKEIKHS